MSGRELFKKPRNRLCPRIHVTVQLFGTDVGGPPRLCLRDCRGMSRTAPRGDGSIGKALGFQLVQRGLQRIDHGAIADLCAPDLLHAGQALLE